MATNKKLFLKSLRYFSFSMPLLFLGPVVLNSAFKNQHNPYYILVLVIGIAICLGAVLLAFLGIKTIMRSLFND